MYGYIFSRTLCQGSRKRILCSTHGNKQQHKKLALDVVYFSAVAQPWNELYVISYGISVVDETKAYLAHPVLSKRLLKTSKALLKHKEKSVYYIFGDTDGLKSKSSMTLFSLAEDGDSVFDKILDCFFIGEMDEVTLMLLKKF